MTNHTDTAIQMTPTCEAVIRYFAGDQNAVKSMRMDVFQKAEDRCRRAGWLESCDVWPHTAVTSAGRAAIGTAERHGTCSTCFSGVHEYPVGWRHVITPLNCANLVPTKVH